MILICFDGSADATAAIDRGGEILNRHPATVLTVWQPFVELLTHSPAGAFGMTPGLVDFEAIDNATRSSAEQQAEEGVRLARQAGLTAEARTKPQVMSTANTILAEADALNASAILMGSRGLTGVKSLLLGSVSHAVLQHADRPVIVVPSPDVAAAREDERRRASQDR